MRWWRSVLRPSAILPIVCGVLAWWGIPTRHYAYWVLARPFQSHVGSVILGGLFGFLLGLFVEFTNERFRMIASQGANQNKRDLNPDVEHDVSGQGADERALHDAKYGWRVGLSTAAVFLLTMYEAHAADQQLIKYNAGVMNGLGSLTTAASRLEQANVKQHDRYTSAGEYLEMGAGSLMAVDSALSSLHIPHTTSIAFSMQYAGDVLLNPEHYSPTRVNETVRYVEDSSKVFAAHRLFGDFLQHPRTLTSICTGIYAVMPASDKAIWP